MRHQPNRPWLESCGHRVREGSLRPRGRRRRPTLEALEGRIVPSTLTVSNNGDSGPGSLRAEIAAAAGGDTIAFARKLMGQTITLTGGELVVDKVLNLEGFGTRSVAISGDGDGRVLDISGDATVTLFGLTITGGTADAGGGVLVETGSTLGISQCTLTGNEARGGADGNAFGGAIVNEAGAELSVIGTALIGNRTDGSNQSYGGAVYNQGSVSIRSSMFSANRALGSLTSFDGLPLPGGCLGGAIMNDDGATLTVSQSGFTGNRASSGPGGDALGGAIDDESASASLGVVAFIFNCTFTGNQAVAGVNVGNGDQGAFGGAIEDLPGTTLTLTGGAFTKNQAIAMAPTSTFASSYAAGGAIDNGASSSGSLSVNLTVDAASFTGNLASGSQDLAPGFANFAYGGAVSWDLFGSFGGNASFSDSSFVRNRAVGEAATDGEFGAGSGGPGSGGAIYAGFASNPITVTSCVLAGNQAIGGSADGTAGDGEGGGIDADCGLIATRVILTGNEAIGGGGGSNSGTGNGFFSGYAAGGGINVEGPATLTNIVLIGNRAVGGPSSSGLGGFALGGGIEAEGVTLTLEGGIFANNAAMGGRGGPGGQGGGAAGGGIDIDTSSSADLIRTTLSDNTAIGGVGGSGGSGVGGGIALGFYGLLVPRFSPDGSTLSVSDGTLIGNQASGGIGGSGGSGGNALGGGIAVVGDDTATISGSDLESNSAIGGSGTGGGDGGNGFGGGLYIDGGSSTGVTGSTITRNLAGGGRGAGGDVDGQGIGGGVYFLGTFTDDGATIIRKNHASTSNNDVFPP